MSPFEFDISANHAKVIQRGFKVIPDKGPVNSITLNDTLFPNFEFWYGINQSCIFCMNV
jgi:hypothetical protein